MKSVIVIVAVIAFGIGCQNAEPQKTEKMQQQSRSLKAEIVSAEIEVNTIKCDMCVTNITNALNQLGGVKKVLVDLEMKKTHVEYVGSALTLSTLETAIAKAGYDANTVKREEAAYLNLDKCCQ